MIATLQKRSPALLSKDRAINLATTYSRGTYRPTTIGCSGLNGRVRDGNGWNPRHVVTRKGSPPLGRASVEKFRAAPVRRLNKRLELERKSLHKPERSL